MSRQGREGRKEGMYKTELRKTKIMYCVIFGFSALIFLIFGAVYADRSANALSMNEDYWINKEAAMPYDTCSDQNGSTIADPTVPRDERLQIYADATEFCVENTEACVKNGTQWAGAFSFNATVLIFSFANFVLLMIGAFWFYPRLFGTCFNCCLGIFHFAAWIHGLNVRFSPLGRACALNVAGNEYEGDGKWNDSMTYKKDANILVAFGTI